MAVLGGGLAGCEAAIHLAQEGKKVHLVEMRPELAPDANIRHRPILMQMVEKYVEAHIGYQGFSGQHLDMNYVARHLGRKTGSLMESNGILSGNAFKLFRGSIDFVKGCAGSVGNEKEDVLLLRENVVNQTIPLILCAEEDVEGNHGASIGELDEKTLFYLMSRGFTKEAAETMIAGARLEAIAAKIPYSEIREQVEKYLEEQHEKL